MSYDLCLVKRAEHPYYIEKIQANIYSLEELCYYLSENVPLIDETIKNETLCDWLRDELGLDKLSRSLREQLEMPGDILRFVLPLFREIQYLNAEELRRFQDRVNRQAQLPHEVRMKLQADHLAACRMYGKAIREYGKILNQSENGKTGAQFFAEVWNNMGSAHAGLFRYKNTADCYWNAWKLTGSREYLRKYASTLPLFLTAAQCREQFSQLDADPQFLEKVQEHNAFLCMQSRAKEKTEQFLEKDVQAHLAALRDAYCRSAQA